MGYIGATEMSDVFGSLVKQRSLGQTAAQADWLIGAGLLAAGINGVALRSMKAPGTAYDDPLIGKDPQPDHMSRYDSRTLDNGGVHINSGIPNKAFVLPGRHYTRGLSPKAVFRGAGGVPILKALQTPRDPSRSCAPRLLRVARPPLE